MQILHIAYPVIRNFRIVAQVLAQAVVKDSFTTAARLPASVVARSAATAEIRCKSREVLI